MYPSQSRSFCGLPANASQHRARSIAGASWIGILLLMCATVAFAAEGEKLYAACIACHGKKGEGSPALNSPALAGQDAAYIERQLHAFRTGSRGTHKSDAQGAQMRPMAAALADDAAVKAVATYISSLPKTVAPSPAGGPAGSDLRKGTSLYHGKCGACHGGKAEGNVALKAPRLAGLDVAYLKRQFAHFRDGVRGTDPKDTPGKQMALMAKTVPTERELDDIIAFIHQQGRPK